MPTSPFWQDCALSFQPPAGAGGPGAWLQPQEVLLGLLLKPIQVSLNGILSLRCVDPTTQLCVICNLAEGALCLTVDVIDENV